MLSFVLLLIHAQQMKTTNAKSITQKSKMDFFNHGGGERVFCNPPYSEIEKWVQKAFYESRTDNTVVVMLIPARTDTKYFHDYIMHRAEIRFIRGRLKFGDSKNSAPFPSIVVIFRGAKIRED